jgi:hypothetical protein
LVIFEGGPLAAKEIGCAEQDNSPSFEGQRANPIATPRHTDLLPTASGEFSEASVNLSDAPRPQTNPGHVRNVQLDHGRVAFLGPPTNLELNYFTRRTRFIALSSSDEVSERHLAPLSGR